ncbi:MAG: hypothetical protein NTV80_01685 [Verrucomicrobia bacterium]|jgi:hypothetical protein|nr:hypothetical protein [Verrucomicrobiota bacterium]
MQSAIHQAQSIQQEQEKMKRARKKWVLTDPIKSDEQMKRNRELRLKIEGPPVMSSSYGW